MKYLYSLCKGDVSLMIVTSLLMLNVFFFISSLKGSIVFEITQIEDLATIITMIISFGGGWIIGSNLYSEIYDTK